VTITEEEELAMEVERLDREDPDWDREARVVTAARALAAGRPRRLVVSTYGEEIVLEAEERNRKLYQDRGWVYHGD
jgi:hypothetical protein